MGSAVVICSAKGGVGKTLLATNLAVVFGLKHHLRTALIDFCPGTGSADLLLDLQPQRSWGDLLGVLEELTSHQLELAATSFKPGVDLIACPSELISNAVLSTEHMVHLLDAFRNQYDWVMLDCPCVPDSLVERIMELVEFNLFVLTPDLPCLRATSRSLDQIRIRNTRIGLVVNQYSTSAAVRPPDIMDQFQEQVLGILPMDPHSVWINISYGEPCVLRRASRLGKTIIDLAGIIRNTIS